MASQSASIPALFFKALRSVIDMRLILFLDALLNFIAIRLKHL